MKRLLTIAALALLFTPVTELAMPNPAAPFRDFRQMRMYFEGMKRHGLEKTMTIVEIDGDGLYFERGGERCRM